MVLTKVQAYEYTVVPLNIGIREGEAEAVMKVTHAFTALLNEYARTGWEYESFEILPVSVSPGCLGTLLGAKPVSVNYYCVVFRKPTQQRTPPPLQSVSTQQGTLARSSPLSRPPAPPTEVAAPPQRFFYLDLDGETQGPVARGGLKRLLDDATLGYDTLVCLEGGEEWKKLEEYIAP